MTSFSFRHFLYPVAGFILTTSALRAQSSPSNSEAIPLPKVVEEISASNPEVKFYESEIAIAKARARGAGAFNDPELSFDVGRKRARDASGVLIGSGTAWSVSVTQTFEWPGRIALRKAIANRQVELAELGLNRFQNALLGRARVLGYSLFAANAKAQAIREVADRFTALKETFLARDPAGVTPLLETRVIEAGELALQRRATQAELEVQAALIELNQLRGAAPDSPLRIQTPTLTLNDPPATDALLAAAKENNFDFRMRRVEVEQQGYEVRLARNERYPAVSVSPFYSQDKAGDKETIVGLGLSVPLPISQRTRSAVDVAEARRRQAEVAVIVAQRELEREVLTAAQAFATKVTESRRWSPDSVNKFRDAAELSDRHYRLGSVPIATYVELQSNYLDAVEALLDTQREALEAGLKLQQATGLNFNPAEIKP